MLAANAVNAVNAPTLTCCCCSRYLSDPESPSSGGETSFPKGGCEDFQREEGCGFKVTPKKGMAAFFYNLLEDGNGRRNVM